MLPIPGILYKGVIVIVVSLSACFYSCRHQVLMVVTCLWPNVYPQHHTPRVALSLGWMHHPQSKSRGGSSLGQHTRRLPAIPLSFRGWLRTKPKSVFHEAEWRATVLLWVLARVGTVPAGRLHSSHPSAALGAHLSASLSAMASETPEACAGGSMGPFREPTFIFLWSGCPASFLRDQFFKLATPLFNHVLGWRVTECMCECHSTLSFFV